MPQLSPGLKKVLLAVLALVGALVTYLTQSCSPSQVQRANSAVAEAQCLAAAAAEYRDLVNAPELATPARAREAFAALKSCRSTQTDAGADSGSK